MNKLYTITLLMLLSLSGQAQNLVAHFTFDSCSLVDVSANAFSLTAGGAAPSPVCATGAAGVANTARYFNGKNWYKTAKSAKFALNKWTISAVVNFSAFNLTNCQVNYPLASDGAQGSDSHYALETNDNNTDASCSKATPVDGQQFFGMSRNGPPAYNSYPSGHYLSRNVWYCLTATFDGADIRTYIDGVLIYTKTWTAPTPAYASNPNPLLYIATGFGGVQYYFDGRIDDVQIYDSVQTLTAIQKYCTDVKTPPIIKTQVNTPFDRGVGMPYPNPASNLLTIPVQSQSGSFKIAIYSIDGRLVDQKEISVSNNSGQLQVDIGNLVQGTYILSITSGSDKVSRRFSRL
jgi:hypothetical protein